MDLQMYSMLHGGKTPLKKILLDYPQIKEDTSGIIR